MFHGIRRYLFQKIFGSDVQLLIFATRFEKHGSRKRGKEDEKAGDTYKSCWIIGHSSLKAEERKRSKKFVRNNTNRIFAVRSKNYGKLTINRPLFCE